MSSPVWAFILLCAAPVLLFTALRKVCLKRCCTSSYELLLSMLLYCTVCDMLIIQTWLNSPHKANRDTSRSTGLTGEAGWGVGVFSGVLTEKHSESDERWQRAEQQEDQRDLAGHFRNPNKMEDDPKIELFVKVRRVLGRFSVSLLSHCKWNWSGGATFLPFQTLT